jgi:CRISPR system Cascade subunit CasB
MQKKPERWQEALIGHLYTLAKREDRGALATLRRGLGKKPRSVPEMHPLVVPWLPDKLSEWDAECAYTVASLFAMHPRAGGTGNFGASCRTIKTDSASAEKRFVALLRSDRDRLGTHLRHAVSLLKVKDEPVDWLRLLRDIQMWEYLDGKIQWQWSREFWREPAAEAGEGGGEQAATA